MTADVHASAATAIPTNPTALTTTGSVDPSVKNDRTREFIVRLDHELMQDLAVGASYTWRTYDRFAWNDGEFRAASTASADLHPDGGAVPRRWCAVPARPADESSRMRSGENLD